ACTSSTCCWPNCATSRSPPTSTGPRWTPSASTAASASRTTSSAPRANRRTSRATRSHGPKRHCRSRFSRDFPCDWSRLKPLLPPGQQRLDLLRLFRHGGTEHLVAIAGHRHVVLDADADAAPAFIHAGLVGRHVDARLHRHHHAGLQHARGAGYAVVAHIVHVETQPVAGLGGEETLVAALGDRRVGVA